MDDGRIGLRAIFDAARGEELTDAELRAWLVIRSYEGRNGSCSAGEDTLAADLHRKPRQFRNLKASLLKKGWLTNRWRGPGPPLLHTRLPNKPKGRQSSCPPKVADREAVELPPRESWAADRAAGWAADRAAVQLPTRGGEGENRRGGTPPLSDKALYAVIRKVIADGIAHRYDRYRTDPEWLAGRVRTYTMPEEELRAIYADAAALCSRPEREMVEEMHRRARLRMDGSG